LHLGVPDTFVWQRDVLRAWADRTCFSRPAPRCLGIANTNVQWPRTGNCDEITAPNRLLVEYTMNQAGIERLTVLVMQHDPLLCAGVVSALRQHAGFDVLVAQVDDEHVDLAGVDVVIADYSYSMCLAAAATQMTHRPLSGARVLTLTSNDREADIRRAIESGVHGYLLLGGALSELIESVTTVARGVRYLCRAVAQRMADSLARASLTTREMDVLRLVVIGESNKEIARRLHIELGTVKSHVSAIMTKLDASSRTQAASIAVTRGLVDPSELAPLPWVASRQGSVPLQAQFA
jgi:two-component system NarL family response regulator